MGYTLAQFTDYLRLSYERERRALRWQVIAPRLAWLGGEPLADALQLLEE